MNLALNEGQAELIKLLAKRGILGATPAQVAEALLQIGIVHITNERYVEKYLDSIAVLRRAGPRR